MKYLEPYFSSTLVVTRGGREANLTRSLSLFVVVFRERPCDHHNRKSLDCSHHFPVVCGCLLLILLVLLTSLLQIFAAVVLTFPKTAPLSIGIYHNKRNECRLKIQQHRSSRYSVTNALSSRAHPLATEAALESGRSCSCAREHTSHQA